MHRTVSLQGASSGMFGSRATPDLAVDNQLKNPLIIIVIHKKECPKIGGFFPMFRSILVLNLRCSMTI